MICYRLTHFARLNTDGTVSRCGHMKSPPRFMTVDEMDSSTWLRNTTDLMSNEVWPTECIRCEEAEESKNVSVRETNNARHDILVKIRDDYLILGGVLDNVCNSACQFCNAEHSTTIGKLTNKVTFFKVDNLSKFYSLPVNRIVQLDINGGEPSASGSYKELLNNLLPSVKYVRINTNCSFVLTDEIRRLADSGIEVTVTVSFDGIGLIHEYVRWPVRWNVFERNLLSYKSIMTQNIIVNLWATINALNIAQFLEMVTFAESIELPMSYALLHSPAELDIRYSNEMTRRAKIVLSNSLDPRAAQLALLVATETDNSQEFEAFVNKQDKLRNISINNYIKGN